MTINQLHFNTFKEHGRIALVEVFIMQVRYQEPLYFLIVTTARAV